MTLQFLDCPTFLVLNMQFETVGTTEAGNHGLRVYLNLSICDVGRSPVDFFHDALHIVAFATPFAPLFQLEGEITIRGGLVETHTHTRHHRINS